MLYFFNLVMVTETLRGREEVERQRLISTLNLKSVQFLDNAFIFDLAITFREPAWVPGTEITPVLRMSGKVYEIFKAVKQRSLQSMV